MSDLASIALISAEELDGLGVNADEAVSCVENLLLAVQRGQAWNAPKAVIQPPDGRYCMATLAVTEDPPLLATKSLVLNPENAARGLPDINSVVTLLDARSGLPLAILDGNWITAVRTAALSGVAAKRLARADSRVVAFIGCGVQACSHLDSFSELFPLTEVRAFNRGRPRLESFCSRAEAMGLKATPCATAAEVLAGADLVVSSVTLNPELPPFIDADWLEAGAFAAITDLAIPWHSESMTGFDRIIVDDREQEVRMPSPLVDPDLVSGGLVELLTDPGLARATPVEKTAFVFRGLALGDLALAALAYQRYQGHDRS